MATPVTDRTGRAPAPVGGGRRRAAGGPADAAGLVVAALLAAAAWLPFLHAPLGPDESGFLLVSQQWHPGSSLYGDHWVDRPPLLLWLFSLAGHLAPTSTVADGLVGPGVKALGALASAAAVLGAGVLAGRVAPGLEARWSRRAAVVVTVALLSTPLFGMPATSGEVLAVPFVLLGLVCLVAALRRSWDRRALALAAASGAAAVAAALVKQNVVDVFVFAAALAVLSRGRVPQLAARVAAFTGGASAVLGWALVGAWTRGTPVADLWDAIVVFRIEALGVISSSASDATAQRLWMLVAAFLASGAAVLIAVAAAPALWRGVRRPAPAAGRPVGTPVDLTGPALALVAWELSAVALGGSYWLHYLTGLVPGVAVLLALSRPGRRRRRVMTVLVAHTVVATIAVWGYQAARPAEVPPTARVMAHLRAHAAPDDGVVVAFGHPEIVAGSGLQSPYEHLWSLPVRVRDPRLEALEEVLTGPAAPQWVVVSGESLASWGLDATAAQDSLRRHYVEQVSFGVWHVWHRRAGPGGRSP